MVKNNHTKKDVSNQQSFKLHFNFLTVILMIPMMGMRRDMTSGGGTRGEGSRKRGGRSGSAAARHTGIRQPDALQDFPKFPKDINYIRKYMRHANRRYCACAVIILKVLNCLIALIISFMLQLPQHQTKNKN